MNLLLSSKDYVSSFISIIIVPVFLAFFVKKSENFATKHDIKGLTEQEEAIKNFYMERYEIFDTDLKFKHDLRNEQYTKLYCKLYSLICASEAARYCSSCYGQNSRYISYDETPIFNIPLSIGDDGISLHTGSNNTSHETETDTLVTCIIQLVDRYTPLASSRLIKVVSLLKEIHASKEQISEDIYSNMRKTLRKQLVIIILQDCEHIKLDLKFEDNPPTDSLGIQDNQFFSESFSDFYSVSE